MAEHLTEEEQIESLKRWWDDNGKSTLVGVALAVTGYFGWGAYQEKQQTMAEAAASSYAALLESLSAAETGQALSDEQKATAKHLAQGIKADYAQSLYAAQAALFMAKQAVEAGDLTLAAAELSWVLNADVEPALALLTRSRLARVQLAAGDFEAALKSASDLDSGAFKSALAEIRGDVLLAQARAQDEASTGDAAVTAARAAYQMALDNLLQEETSRGQLLQMKIDNLQLAPLQQSVAGEEPTAEITASLVANEGEG